MTEQTISVLRLRSIQSGGTNLFKRAIVSIMSLNNELGCVMSAMHWQGKGIGVLSSKVLLFNYLLMVLHSFVEQKLKCTYKLN